MGISLEGDATSGFIGAAPFHADERQPSPPMKVIVTAGPSYEPIDQVRRITNFSTGELGQRLAGALAQAGCEVWCLRGVSATYPGPAAGAHLLPFTTNDDLLATLTRLSREHEIHALFHVAALADFKVRQVQDAAGHVLTSAKLDSRGDGLTLHLEPARKILRELHRLFPPSLLVGWKYELTGTRTDALDKAWSQLRDNHTNACVVNGQAWGEGFGFCTPPEQVQELSGKAELIAFLVEWLRERAAQSSSYAT